MSGDNRSPAVEVIGASSGARRLVRQHSIVATVSYGASAHGATDSADWLRRGPPAAEQSVEMLSKAGADAIKGNWIDAGIDVRQNESNDLEGMPENVVVVLRFGVEVEPEQKDVHR